MFMFATLAIFAATAAPVQAEEQLESLQIVTEEEIAAEADSEAVLLEDDAAIAESSEIVFDCSEADSEVCSEEN